MVAVQILICQWLIILALIYLFKFVFFESKINTVIE